MIEIVLDENGGDTFLDKSRPVFAIKVPLAYDLAAYQTMARQLIEKYAKTPIVIIQADHQDFSINLFALALFLESCFIENKIECAVFKVADSKKATEAYKPYVALTIALKYVMRLISEDVKMIYKEISGLGYLGLDIRNDYLADKIYLKLQGTAPVRRLYAETVSEALVCAGILKALALANTGASLEAEVKIQQPKQALNMDEIIIKIIEGVRPWIN